MTVTAFFLMCPHFYVKSMPPKSDSQLSCQSIETEKDKTDKLLNFKGIFMATAKCIFEILKN